jgi:hypothetical protein
MGLNIYITADKKINTDSLTFYFQGADSVYIDSIGSLRIASNGLEEYFLAPSIWQEDIAGNLYFGAFAEYDIIAANAIKISVYNINIELKTKIAMKKMQMSGCSGIPNQFDQANIYHHTYYGQTNPASTADEYNEMSTAMTTDDEGNIYLTGFTNSPVFPIYQSNPAPFQPTISGLRDGFIISFDNNMVRRWTTHVGGSAADTLTCITYNPNDDRMFFGGTTSSNNLPNPNFLTNSAYYDNSYNGSQDAILGSCDKLGVMKFISYIGGGGYDKAAGICVAGDVVMLTGNTKSTNISSSCTAPNNGSFPTCGTAGEFVQTTNAGGQDIFLMKFEADKSLSWSTLIGSNADDKVFDIEPQPSLRNNATYFYISGETQKNSTTGPFNGDPLNLTTAKDFPMKELTGNSYFQSVAGGFILMFNNFGKMEWGTTVKGVKKFQSLEYSRSSIYAAGYATLGGTNSCNETTNGVPICTQSGGYYGNEGELYLARFNNDAELIYSSLNNALLNNVEELYNKPLDKLIDMDANENGDIFILTLALYNSDPNYSYTNFVPYSPIWTGCYYQDISYNGVAGSGHSNQYDCAIISFDKNNYKNWATYLGGGVVNDLGLSEVFYPLLADYPSAIACYQDKDLFVSGYTGKDCFYSPMVDAGMTPTGQAYFYDDVINSTLTNPTFDLWEDFDVFITKFDMGAVNVGIKKDDSKTINFNKVYPTITDNFVNVYLSANFSNKVTLTIIDIQGKEVFNQQLNLNNADKTLALDLTSFSKGIYLLRIQGTNGNSETFKLIKK